MQVIQKVRVSIILSLVFALAILVPGVSAHTLDSDLVVNSVRVGPYHLSVWTVYSADDVVRLHASTLVNDAATEAPVMSVSVEYAFESLSGDGEVMRAHAGPAAPTNGFLHELDITLANVGRYRVTVSVEDAEGTAGQVQYYIVAYPVSMWTKGIVLGLMGTGIAGTLWLIWEGVSIWRKKEIS